MNLTNKEFIKDYSVGITFQVSAIKEIVCPSYKSKELKLPFIIKIKILLMNVVCELMYKIDKIRIIPM